MDRRVQGSPPPKLILSRKGFDSAHGGCPSPILDNNLLCSLPIPDDASPTRYRDISFNNSSIATIVESLTHNRITRTNGAHLDPDLRDDAIPRTPGWRRIFGQAGAAQTHLARNKVGVGDLFLFFGSFQRAEMENGTLRFQHSTPKLHVIFGWLQIAAVHQVTNGLAARIPWAARHPHLTTPNRYNHNTIYVASSHLSSIDVNTPGAGLFEKLRPELILTETNPYKGCANWKLPGWLHPNSRPPLTYHSDLTRWTKDADSTHLKSAHPGQEFILDLTHYPEALGWLRKLFANRNTPPSGRESHRSLPRS